MPGNDARRYYRWADYGAAGMNLPFFGANRGGGMREKKFSALMRRVEARRLELGMNKTELAAELGTTDDAVRAWMTGRTIGRPETVQKLKAFLQMAERSIL